MNKIMLIGNLGRDPEMNYTPDGVAVAKFTLAVTQRRGKSATGERQEETTWFNVVAWRQLAEICSTYLKKGAKVFIEGRLTMRKYTDKTGAERMAVEVVASDMEMLTPKGQQTGSSSTSSTDTFLSEDGGLGDDLDQHPF
jgi:single-strand DNA-binding protein